VNYLLKVATLLLPDAPAAVLLIKPRAALTLVRSKMSRASVYCRRL
jgi:hypothetical protein